ncbi:hypothetical protein MBANPS3_001039 [Mucor bainieri]
MKIRCKTDYQNPSTTLKIKHFYALVSSLKSLKTVEIKQEQVNAREQQMLSILSKKRSLVKLIVPKNCYVAWVSALDKLPNKFNVLLCYPQPPTVLLGDDNTDKENQLRQYEKMDAALETTSLIPSKRALDLILTPPDYRQQRDEMTQMYKRMMLGTTTGASLPA